MTMRKKLLPTMLTIATLAVAALLLSGCGANTPADSAVEDEPQTTAPATVVDIPSATPSSENTDAEPTVYSPGQAIAAPASTIPLDMAAAFFTELEGLFDADNGALWGIPLHTPVIFLDIESRDIVANRPDTQGLLVKYGAIYVGTLPENLPAIYSLPRFGGQSWAMLPWHLLLESDDKVARQQLMAHLAFHNVQPTLFGNTSGWNNSHMEEKTARILIQLEINALAHALGSTGPAQTDAIQDALAIRAERRRLFRRSAENENLFEVHEGLAMYTDMRLVQMPMEDVLLFFEGAAERLRNLPSLTHAFGYDSGALYGFLLDETGVPWQADIRYGADLGLILQEALGITQLPDFDQLDLLPYGYLEITAFEIDRLEAHERFIQELTDMFLDRPTLIIPRDLAQESTQINPASIFNISGLGQVMGANVVISGAFGRLDLYDGFALDRRGEVHVLAEGLTINENRVTGTGWVMELNEGFEIDDHQVVQR
jgi:hypothetical protein